MHQKGGGGGGGGGERHHIFGPFPLRGSPQRFQGSFIDPSIGVSIGVFIGVPIGVLLVLLVLLMLQMLQMLLVVGTLGTSFTRFTTSTATTATSTATATSTTLGQVNTVPQHEGLQRGVQALFVHGRRQLAVDIVSFGGRGVDGSVEDGIESIGGFGPMATVGVHLCQRVDVIPMDHAVDAIRIWGRSGEGKEWGWEEWWEWWEWQE